MPRLVDLGWPSSPIGRWTRGLVTTAAMLGVITGVVALVEPPLYAPYLLVVLVAAMMWGIAPAMVIAVVSVGVYEHLFGVTEPRELVTAVVRLLTAVLVGQLAGRLRQALRVSARINEEQSALRRVATLVAGLAPAPAVFEAVSREVGLLWGADLVHMVRYEPDGTVTAIAAWSRQSRQLAVGTRFELDGPSIATEVRRTGGPGRIESYEGAAGAVAREARTLGIRSSVGCPIQVTGQLWGVIAASTTSSHPFPAGTESQIASFTELVATAVQNAEARAELTESRARIIATADQTRRRLERDLHDGAQQRLVSLSLELRELQAALPPGLNKLGAGLEHAIAGLSDALEELREMARGIHPAILAHGGLTPALKALARRSSLPVEVTSRIDRRLPEQVEVSAYYVVAEALTNATKHAHAAAVTITVEAIDNLLRIRVQDDGRGGARFTGGAGLVGLKDRVEALSGRIVLDSPHGAGTTLRAELPLTDPSPETDSVVRCPPTDR